MFLPYHRFDNCTRLDRLITGLDSRSASNVVADCKRYHSAVLHKLRSAKTYIDELETSLNDVSLHEVTENFPDVCFQINRSIDGFFYCGGSVLDILAREVLSYYGLEAPQSTYFSTARTELEASRPGDPLIERLRDPVWRSEFIDYRNALTHEVVLAPRLTLQMTTDGNSPNPLIELYLPDDPRSHPDCHTFDKKYEASAYCKTALKRLLRLISPCYGEIAGKLRRSRALPL